MTDILKRLEITAKYIDYIKERCGTLTIMEEGAQRLFREAAARITDLEAQLLSMQQATESGKIPDGYDVIPGSVPPVFTKTSFSKFMTEHDLCFLLVQGQKWRPVAWRNAALFKDGYCVIEDNKFIQRTPHTIGLTTSPAITGAREAIEQFGAHWERVD